MLSGYSCFCQDAPMACRLGLAAGLRYGGFACPGALADGLATAGGEDPTDGAASVDGGLALRSWQGRGRNPLRSCPLRPAMVHSPNGYWITMTVYVAFPYTASHV